MTQIAAVSILLLTLTLALRRPMVLRWRIHHGHAAVFGALLIVILGIVPPPLAIKQLKSLLDPFTTIISLMLITSVTERAGLFSTVANRLSIAARGQPKRLFTYLFFTGAAVGTLFTNDAAVLIFTPLVIRLIESIQDGEWTEANKLPFYFAVLYVANVVAVLVISNPIDIIVCDMFGISFLDYAKWNALPGVVSIIVSYIGLRIAFRKSLPVSYLPPSAPPISKTQRRQMIICGTVLAATLVGFFLQQFIGVPIWAIALCGATVLVVCHTLVFRSNVVPVVRSVGWDVLIFVAGMFIIATGVRNIGITEQLAQLIVAFGGTDIEYVTHSTGFTACVVSAVMNNHPTSVTMGLVIRDMDMPALETKLAAFAALMGGDLGPKMLPTGSLAAMLWFRILRSHGINVSYMKYVKLGIPITLAALVLSILTLNLEIIVARLFV